MGSGFLRNAPCACGSGRKYKKCCGKALPPLKTLDDKVVDFTMSGLHDRELQEAWEEWGEEGSFKKAELLFDIEVAYGQAKVHQPELSRQAFLDSSVGTIKRLRRGYRARRTISTTVTEHGPLPRGMGPEAIMATMALERGRLWPEKPVPALGGRTPAEAAQDPDGRALLGVLLKEYEANQARGGRQPGVQGLMNIPAIVWMRKALGLAVEPELAEALEALDSAAGLQ